MWSLSREARSLAGLRVEAGGTVTTILPGEVQAPGGSEKEPGIQLGKNPGRLVRKSQRPSGAWQALCPEAARAVTGRCP